MELPSQLGNRSYFYYEMHQRLSFFCKKATPEDAARNIELIWEERYSIVQSLEGGKPCTRVKLHFAVLPQVLMLQCSYQLSAMQRLHIICAK